MRAWSIGHFGFEGMYSIFWGQPRVPVELGVCPALPLQIIEETDAWRVYRGADGAIQKQFHDTGDFMHSTQFLEYPIKGGEDWERFRDERLDSRAPCRYPAEAEWQALKARWKDRDFALSIDGGSFYGLLRDWSRPGSTFPASAARCAASSSRRRARTRSSAGSRASIVFRIGLTIAPAAPVSTGPRFLPSRPGAPPAA